MEKKKKNGKNSKNLKIKKFLLFEVHSTYKKKRGKNENFTQNFRKKS